jgi:hypothetical protein
LTLPHRIKTSQLQKFKTTYWTQLAKVMSFLEKFSTSFFNKSEARSTENESRTNGYK